MSRKLTAMQTKFVDYYIETGNATQSAIKAGYSERTAAQTGFENLKKPYIAKAIEERNKEIESERIADMIEVKQFWTSMLRDLEQDPQHRLKASEFLARTNAAFVDRQELTGRDGEQLGFDVVIIKPGDDDDETDD